MNTSSISPAQLAELCKEGKKIELIDVRTPVEFREVHVEFARNIPLDQLDAAAVMQARNGSADEPLYVICRSGGRGQQACEKFLKAGFSNVVNVEGGTLACVEAGLPVVRGKKAISLERQVRIAAGSLVLLGAVLGWFVHPAFIGLSAFVGAGLVFAGITDTCGMGMILARMPWNQCGHRREVLLHTLKTQARSPDHETADCRWRGRWSIGSRSCSPLVGRCRDRSVRAWAGRVVRQLRSALLCRRRNRRAGQAAGHDAGAVADPVQARRAHPVVGRSHRPRRKKDSRPRPRFGARIRGNLRQADPRSRSGAAAAADSRHRLAGNLHLEKSARRGPHQGASGPRRQAGGRGGGGVHRPGTGGKLREARHRNHGGREARPGSCRHSTRK